MIASARSAIALSLVTVAGCTTSGIQVDKNQLNDAIRAREATVDHSTIAAEPDFRPIDPITQDTFFVPYDSKGKTEWRLLYWSELAKNVKEINKYLPIHSAAIFIQKKDASGNAKFMTNTVTAEAGSYRVLMDFMKFRMEPMYGAPNTDPSQGTEYYGTGKVGVGMRVSIDLLTKKAAVDLSSLLAIGVAAKLGEVQGSLTVDVIGVDSKDITNLIPLNAVVDESSIQQTMQALASIKTKIHDDGVLLTPHIVAVRPSAASSSKEESVPRRLSPGKPLSAPK
jgi:hypothetical protein